MPETRMLPLPQFAPPRVGAASLPLAMELRLARRGGRAFALRAHPGDVTVTLPEVGGSATVLVPRGFGYPLFGRRIGSELRAEPAGEPCAPARWVPAGGVSAWLRAIPAPRGPAPVVLPPARAEGPGAWLCVRPAGLAWSALRLVMPAAGHGPVAVADRWVRAVSPTARARGVARGMSLALARRHCPELVTYAPSGGVDLTAEVARRLETWFGPVVTRRGALFVRVSGPSAPGPDGVDIAERVARLLWQELGVESRIALAPTTEAARGLAALLEPGWVGVAAAAAAVVWAGRARSVARCAAGARRAAWRGAPLPDLEGAVARAALLTGGLRRSGRGNLLQIRIVGARASAVARIAVPEQCGRVGLARLAEGVLRREGAALGPIEAMSLALLAAPRVSPAPPQVAVPLPTGLSRKTWFRVGSASPAATARREPELPAAAGPVAGAGGSPSRARRGAASAPPAPPPRPAQLALLPRVR